MGKKRGFSAQFPSFSMKGLGIGVVMACMLALPQYSSNEAEASEVTIREDMPANIPQAILDDWKAKGITDKAKGHAQRIERMKPFAKQLKKIVYGRHYDLGGSIIGWVEEISESYTSGLQGSFNMPPQGKSSSYPKSGNGNTAVMVLELEDYYSAPKVLYENSGGVIRDPTVNYDGDKVAFAMSKDGKGMHIYEINADGSGAPIQLTNDDPGLNIDVSDFEPCYLPTNDIIFCSSRCLGQVDCNWNITSNLYIMGPTGNYNRRIGFDQVHTFYPSVMDDGTIMYSRWEYNDRNVSTVFGVFTMYVDGSHQTELFGNQLEWPNTFPQPRQCPGTKPGSLTFISTIGGHMGKYCDADLAIVDPLVARNEAKAVQRIAPKRANPSSGAFSISGPPDADKKFQTPYPLSKEWFLISYREKMGSKFNIYLMNLDGDRELLAWDNSISCSQPFPMCPRERPRITKIQADYTKEKSECSMSNAYVGINMNNVAAGSIDRIRVIALDYRISPWFGNTGTGGYMSTPVARFNGSWESKRILGETKVESDGSADFWVPPRTPVYFQLLDNSGCCIQTMRSWATLMPGEKFACYGCHEDKNSTPPPVTNPKANTPQDLTPSCGLKDDYFRFGKILHPIFEAKCVSCHKKGHTSELDLSTTKLWTNDLSDAQNNNAFRYWSTAYWNLSNHSSVNFITVMDGAKAKTPNTYGSPKSKIIQKLKAKSGGMSSVNVTDEEIAKIAMWIDLCIPFSGRYMEDMRPADSAKYEARLQRRRDLVAAEDKRIKQFIDDGQPVGVIDNNWNNKGHNAALPNSSFAAHFSPVGNRLFIKAPCEGTIALTDMLGRQLLTSSIKKDAVNVLSGISIKPKLPKGIYVVKFRGGAIKENRVLNVL